LEFSVLPIFGVHKCYYLMKVNMQGKS